MYSCNLIFSKYKLTIFTLLFSNLSFFHGLKCGLYNTAPLHDLNIHKNVRSPWPPSSTPTQDSFSLVKYAVVCAVCACLLGARVDSFRIKFLDRIPEAIPPFSEFPFSYWRAGLGEVCLSWFLFYFSSWGECKALKWSFQRCRLILRENRHVKTKGGSWPL